MLSEEQADAIALQCENTCYRMREILAQNPDLFLRSVDGVLLQGSLSSLETWGSEVVGPPNVLHTIDSDVAEHLSEVFMAASREIGKLEEILMPSSDISENIKQAKIQNHRLVFSLTIQRTQSIVLDLKDIIDSAIHLRDVIFPLHPSWQRISNQESDEAMAKQLIDNSQLVIASKDVSGSTPLSYAAQKGHETIAKLLLKTGQVQVDSKDTSGQTPLSWAARGGHEAVAKLLLETGQVQVDSKDTSGQTPLSWAARGGHEAVAKLLLETGQVQVDSKDTSGQTPLSWAARGGHEAVAKLLLETGQVQVDSKDTSGQTPLSWAARGGHEAVAKLLLETGQVQVDSKDTSGQTPLSWAARGGHEAVAKLLLENSKEDIAIAEDDRQTLVSTTDDVIAADRITAGAQSLQFIGQMPHQTLQYLTFAFQAATRLHEVVKSFESHQQQVRDLMDELGALSGVLTSLRDTLQVPQLLDISGLRIPLQRCGSACAEFEKEIVRRASHSGDDRTSFRDWAKLRYMCDDIDGFRRLLASYKLTISVALADANLRMSSAMTENAEDYHDLINTTEADLKDRLESIDTKLELMLGSNASASKAELQEVKLIHEERLNTEICLQTCVQLSDHIAGIQLTSRYRSPEKRSSGARLSLERITNEGLEECRNSLSRTAKKLEGYERELFTRLMNRSTAVITSDNREDLARLRDEWEATRQSMQICAQAYERLHDNVSTMDKSLTDDAVQFIVSTGEKTIHGHNRGLGWRTRQFGGYVDEEALQEFARSLTSITVTSVK